VDKFGQSCIKLICGMSQVKLSQYLCVALAESVQQVSDFLFVIAA
jgi:hypothetical protein